MKAAVAAVQTLTAGRGVDVAIEVRSWAVPLWCWLSLQPVRDHLPLMARSFGSARVLR